MGAKDPEDDGHEGAEGGGGRRRAADGDGEDGGSRRRRGWMDRLERMELGWGCIGYLDGRGGHGKTMATAVSWGMHPYPRPPL